MLIAFTILLYKIGFGYLRFGDRFFTRIDARGKFAFYVRVLVFSVQTLHLTRIWPKPDLFPSAASQIDRTSSRKSFPAAWLTDSFLMIARTHTHTYMAVWFILCSVGFWSSVSILCSVQWFPSSHAYRVLELITPLQKWFVRMSFLQRSVKKQPTPTKETRLL